MMVYVRRRLAALRPAPPPPTEAAPAPPPGATTVEGGLRLTIQRRDEEIASLTAERDALAEKLALCEAALGDVSEQLAAAQAAGPAKARGARSQG